MLPMRRSAFVAAWAVPLLLPAGTGEFSHFVDIAHASGVTASTTFGGVRRSDYILESTGTGVAIFDYDGDGANDVFIANGTTLDAKGRGTPSQLYHNDGSGHFTDVAARAGITRTGWAQAACAGDFDNDGRTDLLVTYYGQNALYRNSGNGRFEDVSRRAGIETTKTRWGSGCTFVDYDRDGFLDIFIANYVDFDLATAPRPGSSRNCDWKGLSVWCGPRGLTPGHNILLHNNRDGTFTDVSEKAGILAPGVRFGLGVAAMDFDNDGWPDIYVACDQTPSLLYRNRHDGTFEEIGDRAGVAYNADGRMQAGMGIAVGDYDGNGLLDIAKTNFSGDRPSLYRNEDGRYFSDVSEEAGLGRNQLLGWGIAFLDVDEDGWPDLVMANGHVYPEVDGSPLGETYRQKTLIYRNLGNGRFADVTAEAGPAFRTPRPSRGLAIGDLNGDGRPEIVIANRNEAPTLLKNSAPYGNAVALALTGRRSNRSAIGARCEIEAGGRRQVAEVPGGGSYYSQNSFTVYFGLGAARRIDHLRIRWPSGAEQKWDGVDANRELKITEGEEKIGFVRWRGR